MRPLNLTAKLKDAANTSAPELSFQRKAVQDFHSRQVEFFQPAENVDLPQASTSSTLDSHRDLHAPDPADTSSTPQNKRPFSSITGDSDAEDVDGQLAQRLYLSTACSTLFTKTYSIIYSQ